MKLNVQRWPSIRCPERMSPVRKSAMPPAAWSIN